MMLTVKLRPEPAEADDELGSELATQNTETLKPEANIARRERHRVRTARTNARPGRLPDEIEHVGSQC